MLDAADDTPDSRPWLSGPGRFPQSWLHHLLGSGPSQVVVPTVPVTGESIGSIMSFLFYSGLLLFSIWLSYTAWTHTANCLVCINRSSPTGKSRQSQGCPFDRSGTQSPTHGVMIQRQKFDSSLGPRRVATVPDWVLF